MKTRQFLRVSYTASFGPSSQDFKLSESYFIKAILKDLAIDKKCDVKLIECDEKEYKLIFG